MNNFRDEHLWEAQIRLIDEDDSVRITGIANLFQNDVPKLRPRFTFPIGARGEEFVHVLDEYMANFLQQLESGQVDINENSFENDSLIRQQVKVAGRTRFPQLCTEFGAY